MSNTLIPFYHGSCHVFDELRPGSNVTDSYFDAVTYAKVRCVDNNLPVENMRVYCLMVDPADLLSDHGVDNGVRVASVRSAHICGVLPYRSIMRLSSIGILRIVNAQVFDVTDMLIA